MAQMVENPPTMERSEFDPWEDPLEMEMQPTPVFLPGASPWTEKPGGLQCMGSQRDGHDWVSKHTKLLRRLRKDMHSLDYTRNDIKFDQQNMANIWAKILKIRWQIKAKYIIWENNFVDNWSLIWVKKIKKKLSRILWGLLRYKYFLCPPFLVCRK